MIQPGIFQPLENAMETKVIETEEVLILDEAFADPEILDSAGPSSSPQSAAVFHRCC